MVKGDIICRKGISLERLNKNTKCSCKNTLSYGSVLNLALPTTN